MKTDLSVLIPTYNRLWSLPEAIESCRGTECRTEVIVVDDGSTDKTWKWLEQQPDVIRLRQPNLGKQWAVNLAFEHATGDYVRFLDSDDWTLPGANDGQIRLARRTGADVVVSGYTEFTENGVAGAAHPWIDCDDFVAQQLGECDSSHYSAYLLRRDFVRDLPHRPECGYRDDRMFVLELALKTPRVAVYEQAALGHRHHGKGRLQFPTGMRMVVTNYQHRMMYRRILDELERRGELTERRRKAAAKSLWPLAHWVGYTHLDEASEIADWIHELDPGFRPPEAGLLGELYRRLGFRKTENLLKLRRVAKQVFFHAVR